MYVAVNNGAEVAIGTTAADPATDTYVPVEDASGIGAYGSVSEFVRVDRLNKDHAQNVKGIKEYGNPDVIGLASEVDAGQAALKLAGQTDDLYNLRHTLKDGTIFYLKVLVGGYRYTDHDSGAVRGFEVPMSLEDGVVEVAAA